MFVTGYTSILIYIQSTPCVCVCVCGGGVLGGGGVFVCVRAFVRAGDSECEDIAFECVSVTLLCMIKYVM